MYFHMKFSLYWHIFGFFVSSSILSCNGSEFFSSVSGLETLFQTEEILLNELKVYVTSLSEHVNVLKSEIETIEREHTEAIKDVEGYLNNPVNAYRLLKRLHSDWHTYEEMVHNVESAKIFRKNMAEHRRSCDFPSDADVEGSAIALVRLQDTYKLDVAQVASGVLNGIKYGTSMSWQDCYMLGHNLYKLRDFNHTIPWLKQSMDVLAMQEYRNDPVSLDVMEDVAAYHQEMGDFVTALRLVNRVLAIDPLRLNNYDTKNYLEQMIAGGFKEGLMHEVLPNLGDYRQSNEFKLYEKVCRGEFASPPTQLRPLRCKLHTNYVAYRLLQPYKMEEHSLDPYIVQFHDVINERQIKVVQSLAKPRMERSKISSHHGIDSQISHFRTSKSSWFAYNEHYVLQDMLRHVHDFTGLNTTHAEELQVANYGIGGHYEPHFDFFLEDLPYDEKDGNRVSTAIYYLSDVEEGGGTAFPFLPLLIKPKMGSVLFWYNLHRSDEPDYRTKHAACPVLKGSKWIANIWLHVRDQFAVRPCRLWPEGGISIKYRDYD